MPSFQDFTYLSSNGKTRIHARKCIPDGAPRAVIQIVHGIAEHINRYDDFARFLAEHGFVAVGEDHLGHGQTAETKEDLGFFAEEDGWNCVVNDLNLLRDQMHGEYPDLPYLFFGHSMGSFLVRTYLIRFPDKYDAAIRAPLSFWAGLPPRSSWSDPRGRAPTGRCSTTWPSAPTANAFPTPARRATG